MLLSCNIIFLLLHFTLIRMVEDEIVNILRNRYEHCCWVHGEDSEKLCSDLYKIYNDAAKNWFIKCMSLQSSLNYYLTYCMLHNLFNIK